MCPAVDPSRGGDDHEADSTDRCPHLAALAGGMLLGAARWRYAEVTVLCNYEVDWCEAMKATYEKTTGQKAVFIRRTDGESLAQIRAEKANPRADVYHAAESASAKALAAEGLLEA
jgi:iron(III) transport system substrate-binding protein